MINKNTKIEEIVKMDNKMMEFFNNEKIDYCCNGYKTIEEVSKEKNISSNDFIEIIKNNIDLDNEKEMFKENLNDFNNLTIEQMVDALIKNHHEKERDLLFEIDPLLNKILKVHYEHHGEELLKLHSLFSDLKKELEIHFIKEEKITFPLILENKNPNKEIIEKINELENEHEKAGDLIREMIDLTDWFKVPSDGCNTYEYTFTKLKELVEDVFTHIFKENSLLFVKYKEREKNNEEKSYK